MYVQDLCSDYRGMKPKTLSASGLEMLNLKLYQRSISPGSPALSSYSDLLDVDENFRKERLGTQLKCRRALLLWFSNATIEGDSTSSDFWIAQVLTIVHDHFVQDSIIWLDVSFSGVAAILTARSWELYDPFSRHSITDIILGSWPFPTWSSQSSLLH